MTDEYTPSMAQVRDFWASDGKEINPASPTYRIGYLDGARHLAALRPEQGGAA